MMIELPKTVDCKIHVCISSSGTVSASCANMAQHGWATLAVHEMTFDVPQEDPTPNFIEALEGQAEDIQAEAAAAVRAIMDQIQQLKCLEHKPESGDE